MNINERFRGYLPIVVDIETAGFNATTDAFLEICIIFLNIDNLGNFFQYDNMHFHIKPFDGANIDKSAIAFNGIDIDNPFRMAVTERQALNEISVKITQELKKLHCTKAILVGHNAFFDLSFLNAATARVKIKNPFHKFSTIDTVTLSALCYGETVLAKAINKAQITWDVKKAHSAIYDAKKTAELFCKILNDNKSIL